MVKLSRTFSQFKPFRALVLGDFMLDTYTTGRVKRISPEAPVPVMEVWKQESRPGGAGNVVLNLTTLGGEVFAVGRIGSDSEGNDLKARLTQEGADTNAILIEKNYKTPVKNRLIADSQQLLRVDFETITPLVPELEAVIIEQLQRLIPQVQVVALSDYGKGFLTNRLIAAALQIADRHQIPVIVDPKGADFTKYKGATLLKPNLSEAYAAAKMAPHFSLDQVGRHLLEISSAQMLLITRSEAGMSLFDQKGLRTDFPVRSKEVKDVTGAGDTVLSMICLGLANGLEIDLVAQLANIAAGISIEKLGCAQVTLSELARRLLEYDSDTKIFDESHTYALHQVLKGKRYSLLVLEKGQGLTNSLFRTIRQLSGRNGHELIIYVRDSHPSDEFIHLLSSLNEVDYIILQTESLKNLCNAIHPHEIYVLEEDRLVHLDPAKNLLDSLIKIPVRAVV
ncbi:MAG: D-glycero-beta-D-manno-heptose-7-phosphate kinase [Chlamydiota bacterium]